MLTAKERHQILILLGHFSRVNLFPIQVDAQSWEIGAGCKSKLKSWACGVAYALFIAHSLYKTVGLLYVFLFLRGIPLHQNIIHGVMAGGSVTFMLWQYFLYWKNAGVTALFVKISLSGVASNGKKPQDWHAIEECRLLCAFF